MNLERLKIVEKALLISEQRLKHLEGSLCDKGKVECGKALGIFQGMFLQLEEVRLVISRQGVDIKEYLP